MGAEMESKLKVEELLDKLNYKQRAFCEDYLIHFDEEKAAIKAGYASASAGARNLTNPKIIAVLDALKPSRVPALKILKEHEAIAFSTVGDLYDDWMTLKDFESLTDKQKSAIESITSYTIKLEVDGGVVDVERFKVKMYDKQKSLDALTKMLGYDAPIKMEQEQSVVINEIRTYSEECRSRIDQESKEVKK